VGEAAAMTDNIVVKGEAMLLGWNQSHNRGSTVTILVADDDLEQFKLLTVAKGKVAGQRFMYAFALIGDDEQPVPRVGWTNGVTDIGHAMGAHAKGGPLSQLAAMWCLEPVFRGWLVKTFREEAKRIAEASDGTSDEEYAARLLRDVCEVESRAEFDTDKHARATFEMLVREPYMAYLKESQ
jgi:hypothetical protein